MWILQFRAERFLEVTRDWMLPVQEGRVRGHAFDYEKPGRIWRDGDSSRLYRLECGIPATPG